MSDQDRADNFFFYYTRLQAARERLRRGFDNQDSIDLRSQIGGFNLADIIDHEEQAHVGNTSPSNAEQVAGSSQQTELPDTSEQGIFNPTEDLNDENTVSLSPVEEDIVRNVFFGSLAWTHWQHQQARERNRFRPLPVRRRLIPPGSPNTRAPPVNPPPVQNPPVPPVNPPPIQNPPMAAIANPKVKFAQFKGKDKEDPDAHVAQFDTKWEASGFDVIYNDDVKK